MPVFENERLINRIEERLDRLSQRIKSFSANGLNDNAKFLEPFAGRLLNLVYDWQLVDPDPGVPNTKAIDLVDNHKRVAVQVSIQESSAKISHTRSMLSDGRLTGYTVAIFFLHHKKFSDHHGLRIINIGTLIGDLIGRPISLLQRVGDLLDEELSNQTDPALADKSPTVVGRKGSTGLSCDRVGSEVIQRQDGTALISIHPFVAVEDAVELFGDESNSALFAPSRREFIAKTVHRPHVADSIEKRLLTKRFACVLGKGASGKTTLGIVIAYSPRFGAAKSFYCDLSGFDEATDIESVCTAILNIRDRHGPNALVILDNIHLAEHIAQRVYLHGWRDAKQPVRLLLLGRFTQEKPAPRGSQSPLSMLKPMAITLAVNASDLVGVFNRLNKRLGKKDAETLTPPVPVLQDWLKTFGGELIAFSAAVRQKFRTLSIGDYDLAAVDAADYVCAEYLQNNSQPLSDKERENLIAIAALTDLELLAPMKSLPFPGVLEVSARRGLVLHFSFGWRGMFHGYQFAHPGLGDLLWKAACSTRSRLEYQAELAQRDPWLGSRIVFRLAEVKKDKESAKTVLAAIVRKEDCFDRIAANGISWLLTDCSRLLDLGVLSAVELDRRLSESRQVVEAALDAPLHSLKRLLNFAHEHLPRTFGAIAAGLTAHPEKLLDKSVIIVRNFLEYTDRRFPDLSRSIRCGIIYHEDALLECALRGPLSDLRHFLEYSDRMLPGVSDAIGNQLLSDPEGLLRRVRAAPLHLLGNFLQYIEERLPGVACVISKDLNSDPYQLLPGTQKTPLDMLGSFVRYAEVKMPNVARVITEHLSEDTVFLVQRALDTPVLELRHFLMNARLPLRKAIIDGLKERPSEFAERTRSAPLGQLQKFLAYADVIMPEISAAIWNNLSSQPEDLIARALASSPGGLRRFLRYAQHQRPDLEKLIVQGLGRTQTNEGNRT